MSKNENCAICRDLGDMCESCKIVADKYHYMASDRCAKINTSDPETTHQGDPVAWMVRREDGSLEGIHDTPRDMAQASYYRMTVTPLYERAGSFEVAQLQKLCDARLNINLMFRAQVAERDALLRKIIDARSENDMLKAVDEAEALLRGAPPSLNEAGRSDLVHRGPPATTTESLVHYGQPATAMPASAEPSTPKCPTCLGESMFGCTHCQLDNLAEQHQRDPVCWVNDQQLLLCSKSPRVDEPDNPMMHNIPRNIAGSALQSEYCNTPLFRNADTTEVVALRGAYLRAGEREHELRTELARLRTALKFYADRDHYSTDDGSSWDSCSGEPANILWHESEPWFIEDGSIARAVLELKASDDIPDFTPGNSNKAERRATALLAQLQADLTARDQQIDALRQGMKGDYDLDAWLAFVEEAPKLRMDAGRYRWLRSRDLETISKGGVFAGLTPDNLVLNEETLDQAIDVAMANVPKVPEPCSGCGTPGYTGNCDKCVPY